MSTNEILWVNRNVAMFVRLTGMSSCRTTWLTEGPGRFRLTVEGNGRSTTAVLFSDALRRAFEGDQQYETLLLGALRNLVHSLRPEPPLAAPKLVVH